jgi:nucleoside-diphosphate-sugar epimerase
LTVFICLHFQKANFLHLAFDKAVVSNPPFEWVLHTASPFHFNVTDTKRDLLDPAINGTTGILKAIKAHAPSVKRVVVTSSFAAIVDPKGKPEGYEYSEKDWNPITEEEAVSSPQLGYRASKTFAERAAWDFVEKEKPNFTLATVNPPLVFGPVVHHLSTLSSLNTSNELVRDLIQGKFKDGLPEGRVFFWIDVRDLAIAHVRAAEREAAAGKRFFVTAGSFNNKLVTEAIRDAFPEYKDQLPTDLSSGEYKPGRPSYNNSQTKEILGIEFTSLQKSIVDTAASLKNIPE